MADVDDNEQDDDDILHMAKDVYKVDKEHWDSLVYEKAKEDLHFLSDDRGAMWDAKEFERRDKTGRAALQIDMLMQFIHQVANDIRQNEHEADVVPVGSDASIDTADVLKGLIKQIQYKSSANEVYETGVTSAIKCGIGYIKVEREFEDDERGFDQVLKIGRVVNPFVIYPDCTFMASDGSDMKHCTELERMRVKDFKALYPDKDVISWDDGSEKNAVLKDDEEVVIAHFYIKDSEEKVLESADGKKQRTVKRYTINKYIMSGSEVLETEVFPGKYIPFVPVIGEEMWEDGKRHYHSLIRKSKQASAHYNLMESIKTDILMKAARANVMVPEGSIDDYAADWMFPEKSMALRYKVYDDQGRPIPPPAQLNPAQVSPGFVEAAASSINDIRSTLGMYQSSVGQNGPEVSGKAIDARKIEGDVATYHFGDNLARSITQVCRIIVCAAPTIYDAARMIQIMNEEGDAQLVAINGAPTPQGQKALHDFSKGSYDIRMTIGASYTTKRQEAEAFLKEIITSQPQLMQVCGDLLFKNSDFAGAQELSARMKRVMNPAITAPDDGQDPAVMQLTQQNKQLQQQLQQTMAQLKDKTADQNIKMAGVQAKMHDMQVKAETDRQDIQSKAYTAETNHHIEIGKAVGDQQHRNRELDIQEADVAGNLVLQAMAQRMDNIGDAMDRLERLISPQQQQPAANTTGAV